MKALVVVVSLLLSSSASAEIVDGKRLEQAVLALPDTKLDSETAALLVAAAIDTNLDPAVLLAQAYIESRFDSTATSRLINGKRRVGSWPSRQAPRGWSGNLYCGIAQNVAPTWARCLALRDPSTAMAAQADELRVWLGKTRGDLPRALAGYGCGNYGVKTGSCNRYPQRVLALAKRLRRAAVVVPLS